MLLGSAVGWVVAGIGGWVVAVVVEIRLLLLWVGCYGGWWVVEVGLWWWWWWLLFLYVDFWVLIFGCIFLGLP